MKNVFVKPLGVYDPNVFVAGSKARIVPPEEIFGGIEPVSRGQDCSGLDRLLRLRLLVVERVAPSQRPDGLISNLGVSLPKLGSSGGTHGVEIRNRQPCLRRVEVIFKFMKSLEQSRRYLLTERLGDRRIVSQRPLCSPPT